MTATAVDPGSDLHTHSDLTDGTASPEAMADGGAGRRAAHVGPVRPRARGQ